MNPINQNIPAEWESYVTQTGIGLEVVPHMLYDTQNYVSTTTTDLPFFQSIPASANISNVKTPGLLPAPQSFLIQNISIGFKALPQTADAGAAAPTTFVGLANDMAQLLNQGIFRMIIGEKNYGPWPIHRLPMSTGLKLTMATQAGAEAANITQMYGLTDGPLWPLFPNLLIAPLQNFSVNLQWPGGALTLSATPLAIQVLFDGQLSRAIQ